MSRAQGGNTNLMGHSLRGVLTQHNEGADITITKILTKKKQGKLGVVNKSN